MVSSQWRWDETFGKDGRRVITEEDTEETKKLQTKPASNQKTVKPVTSEGFSSRFALNEETIKSHCSRLRRSVGSANMKSWQIFGLQRLLCISRWQAAALMHPTSAASPCSSPCTHPNDEAPHCRPVEFLSAWIHLSLPWAGSHESHREEGGPLFTDRWSQQKDVSSRPVASHSICFALLISQACSVMRGNTLKKIYCRKHSTEISWSGFSQQVKSEHLNMNLRASSLLGKVSHISLPLVFMEELIWAACTCKPHWQSRAGVSGCNKCSRL